MCYFDRLYSRKSYIVNREEFSNTLDKNICIEICSIIKKCEDAFFSVKSEYLTKKELMEGGKMSELVEKEDVAPGLTHHNESSVVDILYKWNLQHLEEFFKDEKITIPLLKRIKSKDLHLILNKLKIGDALTFKYCLEEWRIELNLPSVDQNENVMDGNSQFSPTPPLSQTEAQTAECTVKTIDILSNHHNGRKVLDQYKNTNSITAEHRAIIINILVQHFDFHNIHMSLQTCHRLETEILEIFPTEKLQFYRTDKRGKIYIKFHNLKKQLKSLSETKTLEENIKGVVTNIVPEENALVSIQSLKYDNLSADEFISRWSSCAKYRLDEIHNKCANMHESLNKWPQYKNRFGFQLMDIDFAVIHKNADQLLGWNEKLMRLSQYMKLHLTIHDKDAKEVINGINLENVKEDTNEIGIKLLWSLHSYLYPTKKFPRKLFGGKQSYGRYTIRDSQESFIFINETMQSLEDHIQFLKNRGDHIQPFILALGNKKSFQIDQFFVYMDGQLLSPNSFSRAVDICFKIFHIFNVEYPPVCYPFWVFIEKFLYNIKDSNNNYPKVTSLLEELSTM